MAVTDIDWVKHTMELFRRDFLKLAGPGLAGVAASSAAGAQSGAGAPAPASSGGVHDVRVYGAAGDGKTIDSPAINRAIEAAAAAGGGTVRFPPGAYASYSIRLKSNIALYLDQGATILGGEHGARGDDQRLRRCRVQ